MIHKNTSRRSDVVQPTRYAWVAAATLIAALILGAFAGIPRVEADSDSIQRGIDADAARYQAMGESYLAKAQSGIRRGIDAGAVRYQAIGESYLARANDDSLAANPELMIARRSYRAAAGILAANPELMVARRWQAQGFSTLGSCLLADEATLAANPELMLFDREYGC